MEKLTFFSTYFCNQENLKVLRNLFLRMKKIGNFTESIFAIQCFLHNFAELNIAILGQICTNKVRKDSWSQKLMPLR